MTTGIEGDWVAELADLVIESAEKRGIEGPITVASGISPSGPIHLGNLREVMVPHFIADELKRRGVPARHIHSWDDYDRLRKVPAGFPESFAEHIGRPLSAIPDPTGEGPSWAEHFKGPFREALARLGVEVEELHQTEKYLAGDYRDEILRAMAARTQIDAILGQYRTAEASDEDGDDQDGDDEDGDDAGVVGLYSPYRPYCRVCGRDLTHVTAYDDDTTELAYHCECGHDDSFRLDSVDHGKLVWKVDWPMRWAYEQVVFEAAGVDHHSPGSSITVGGEIIRAVYGVEPPESVHYSFVGTDGVGKLSGSRGGALTPGNALEIIEPTVLRSLYCREPRRSFTIAFNEKVANLYDDWDRSQTRVEAGTAETKTLATYQRAIATASGPLPRPEVRIQFRTLASVADITNGDRDQILRIAQRLVTADQELTSLDALQPRLDCARTWVDRYMPPEQRTNVREAPDAEALAALDDTRREAVDLLLADLETQWDLDGLTTLVYGIPKEQLGLARDARDNSPELKDAQRAFFVLLYNLLVGSDTGPRLPTLLLSLGPERVRQLLGG